MNLRKLDLIGQSSRTIYKSPIQERNFDTIGRIFLDMFTFC